MLQENVNQDNLLFFVDEKGERIPLTIADYDREKKQLLLFFRYWAILLNY